MNTNMMELNMNEMAAVAAGEMTREERQKVLAPKEGEGIVTTVGKAITRKVVNGIEYLSDLVEPVTKKMESFGNPQTAAKHIFKGLWNTVTGWF